MTPQPLRDFQLANLMAEIGRDLSDRHPHDVLTLAGFLATNALRCWGAEERVGIAAEWTEHVLATVRESHRLMALDDPDDALAARIADACQGVADADVACELLAALAECIGRATLHQRSVLVAAACAELRQYVSEIPPLPSDPCPGNDHAA